MRSTLMVFILYIKFFCHKAIKIKLPYELQLLGIMIDRFTHYSK